LGYPIASTAKKNAENRDKVKYCKKFFIVTLSFIASSDFSCAENPNSRMTMYRSITPILDSYFENHGDFYTFLSSQKGINMPADLYIGRDLSKIPVRPNEDLSDSIQSDSDSFGPPPFHLVWIGPKHFGGLYYIIGSGACQNWIMFQADGQYAKPVYPPDIFEPSVCGDDGGGFGFESFIAVIDNQVVAIKDGIEQTQSGTFRFHIYLQVWDGSSWTPPAEVAVDVNFRN
jgi:hypothetical protein